MSYARLLQAFRVSREAGLDEFRREAMWSYRAKPPVVGTGERTEIVPFKNWFAQISGEKVEIEEPKLTEISDKELEFFMQAGKQEFNPTG